MLNNFNFQVHSNEQKQSELETAMGPFIQRRFKQNVKAIHELFPEHFKNIVQHELSTLTPVITRTKHLNISNNVKAKTLYDINPDKQVTKQVDAFLKHALLVEDGRVKGEQISVTESELGSLQELYPTLEQKLVPVDDRSDNLVILGCGLGIHLEKLLSIKNWNSVLIVEPNIELLHNSLYGANWSAILRRTKQQNCKLELVISDTADCGLKGLENWQAERQLPHFYLFRHYQLNAFNMFEMGLRHEGKSLSELVETCKQPLDDDRIYECELPLSCYFLENANQASILSEARANYHTRYQHNSEAFENSFPDIAAAFSQYKAKEWLLFLMPNGEANLLNKKTGSVFFQHSPQEEAKEYFEHYKKHPRMDMLDARYTLRKPSPFIHYEYSDKLRALVQELPEEDLNLPQKIPSFIMYGVGLGQQIESLFTEHEVDSFILYEPEWDYFFASIFVTDWAKVIEKSEQSNGKLYLNIGDDGSNMYDDIYSRLHAHGINMLSYTFFFISYFNRNLDENIRNTREQLKILLNISEYFDHSFFNLTHTNEALRRNCHLMLNKKPQSIADKIADTPVFLVGNGPSLDQSVEVIKANQGKAIIVSCGTALKALYEVGIKPDFHAEVEQTNATTLWISQVPDKAWLKSISLLTVCGVHPNVMEMFKDSFMGMKLGESSSLAYAQIDPRVGELQGILYSYPTVSNCALSSVIKLGFKQIYMFGVDLGFSDPSYHHSQHSAYYKEGGEELYDYTQHGTGFRVPGNFEDYVFTKHEFKFSAEVMVKTIAEANGLECYNTSNGAFIEGTSPLPLDFVLLGNQDLDKADFLQDLANKAYTQAFSPAADSLDAHFSKERFDIHFELLSELWEKPCESQDDVLELLHSHNDLVKSSRSDPHSLFYLLMRGSSSFCMTYLTRLAFSTSDEQLSIERFQDGAELWKEYLQQARDFYWQHWGEFDQTEQVLADISFEEAAPADS
ncbi:DUF115 domain-containing protein [Agarivorans aestuarii]|uniref:DUF115 domain-containing protein n=1 Tax=Agarivorans aestuarii TaxID=1563703 RepID=A0ABU7G0F1_9ALTE|nr:6-hydroxymethylpterin diphosphokinase MptE-like protein [Agarivorans aestuarii]MEE1672891.1 DUF115 domain-containing protein [Agarivorans aestuarii]